MDTIEGSDLDMAFGGKAMEILPPYDAIPAEFKKLQGNKWIEFVSDMFFHGGTFHATPKPGIDESKVWRMFKACIGSFEPQHEHKIAGLAFMLSEFFEDITWAKD